MEGVYYLPLNISQAFEIQSFFKLFLFQFIHFFAPGSRPN